MSDGYRRLLEQLHDGGRLTDQWRPVFEKAPRELFVPGDGWALAGDLEALVRLPIHRGTDPAGWLAAVHSDTAIVTQLNDGQPDTDGSPFASSANTARVGSGMRCTPPIGGGSRRASPTPTGSVSP